MVTVTFDCCLTVNSPIYSESELAIYHPQIPCSCECVLIKLIHEIEIYHTNNTLLNINEIIH